MSGEFRFEFERIAADATGYYMARWDQAVPVSVIAASEPAALVKAREMSGPCTAGKSRYDTYEWRFRLLRINELTPLPLPSRGADQS